MNANQEIIETIHSIPFENWRELLVDWGEEKFLYKTQLNGVDICLRKDGKYNNSYFEVEGVRFDAVRGFLSKLHGYFRDLHYAEREKKLPGILNKLKGNEK